MGIVNNNRQDYVAENGLSVKTASAPQRTQNGFSPRPVYNWPSFGDDARALLRAPVKVYWDPSALKQPGFKVFMEAWSAADTTQRSWTFIPGFAFDSQLDEATRSVVGAYRGVRINHYQDVNDFQAFFTKVKALGKIVYIIQDESRIDGIFAAAKEAGVFLRFYGISDNGTLRKLEHFNTASVQQSSHMAAPKSTAPVSSHPKFKIETVMATPGLMPPRHGRHPVQGSSVWTADGEQIRLVREVTSISQSITYETSISGKHAKIYTEAYLRLDVFEKKCRRMLEIPIAHPAVCWPEKLLFNEAKEFVGVLVPAAIGLRLMDDVLNQSGLETNFPDWRKRDLVQLAKTVLGAVICLNDHNVLFGNIDANSILVKDAGTVYFTNLEGCQIEGYPCDRQNTIFQPPELQLEERKLRLYTPGQENYGIATLMFMILMNGRIPYTKGRNKELVQSIANMEFPFYFGKERGVKSPIGRWRFVWSHLSPELKRAFFLTFMKGKDYSEPETRRNARYWLNCVDGLARTLENPYDKESLSIFPRTYKKDRDTVVKRCNYCGIEHPAFFFDKGRNGMFEPYNLCIMCSHKQSDNPKERFRCERCGKVFIYNNGTALYHRLMNYEPQRYCRDCKRQIEEERNEIAWTGIGRCGHRFSLTKGEYDFHMNKFGRIPSRCPNCRNAGKNR